MAISWSIMESVALAPNAVVQEAVRYLERLTSRSGWTTRASGEADGVAWSWPLGTVAVEVPPALQYSFELVAELEDLVGYARVDSDQEIEDDGSPVKGRAFVEVVAARDQVSAVVSLATALAIYDLSRGEFSGTGFDTSYQAPQLSTVLSRLEVKNLPEDLLSDRIARLGRLLGVQALPVYWA